MLLATTVLVSLAHITCNDVATCMHSTVSWKGTSRISSVRPPPPTRIKMVWIAHMVSYPGHGEVVCYPLSVHAQIAIYQRLC